MVSINLNRAKSFVGKVANLHTSRGDVIVAVKILSIYHNTFKKHILKYKANGRVNIIDLQYIIEIVPIALYQEVTV